MSEKIPDAFSLENKEKSMHEEAMESVLRRAEEASKDGKTTFENAFVSLLESDGYTGGLYPSLEEALKKRDVAELVHIAHMDGWL